MGLSKIQIITKPESHFPGNTNICLSDRLAKKLGISHDWFKIRFGSSMAVGHSWLTQQKNMSFQVHEQLSQQLYLPSQASIYAHFDPHTQNLYLGPILGILIDTLPSNQQQLKFGLMTKFLEECAIAGRIHGILVAILLPQTLSTQKKQMQAWIYQQKKWIKTTLPLPNVIYNRITSRRIESQQENQYKLKMLRTRYKIPIFNEMFLNKLQVHRLLEKDPQIKLMLPTTYPFQKNVLTKMLSGYPVLYLKPTNGSLGQGIIRLIKTSKQIYYQSATTSGTLTLTFRSIPACVKAVTRRIGKQSYLIQQGLSLATYAGKQLDFRVLAQKNHLGNWSITSTVARVANDQHIVSNLAQGGMIRKATDVLQSLQIPRKPSLKQLKATSLKITQTFDRLADGHFAELGIDLALDRNGKIWIIELNSKPSKTDDSVINPALSTRPSVNKLMKYIHFLTGIQTLHSHTKQKRGAKK